MLVVKNFFVTCGVCGCVHRVRVQAGFINDYPVRYLCPQCRNRIDGAVHLDPSCALIDFNLDPGTVASMGGNLDCARVMVELSGELPSYKISMEHCACMTSPFIRASGLIPFDELSEYVSDVVYCLHYYREDWPTLRTALQLYCDGHDDYADKVLSEFEWKLLGEDNRHYPLLNRIARMSWLGLPMIAGSDAHERAVECKKLFSGLETGALLSLAGYYLKTDMTAKSLLAEINEVLDSVAESYPVLLNGFTFLMAGDAYDLEKYGTFCCTPSDIEKLYYREYELIGSLLVLFIGLDNIERNGAFDVMPKGVDLGAKSFDKLSVAPKAKRFNAVGTGSFTGLIKQCWNPVLRNAFSHNRTDFDCTTQVIRTLREDGTNDSRGNTYLLEMVRDCILMAREIMVIRDVIFHFIGRGLW